MTTLLQIHSSLYGANGASTALVEHYGALWRARHPAGRVVVRDVVADPVPHLTAERFAAFAAKPGERASAQQAAVDYSDTLIAELQSADEIVLGLPMYNFGVPSQLKAWFDHVARAGVTFRYGARGAEGALRGKRVIGVATRGSRYADAGTDHETAHVRQFFALLGVTRLELVVAEGLALGPDVRTAALAHARTEIERLASRSTLAA